MFFDAFFSAMLDDFINPSDRLYWPVLIFSVLLAWCFLLLKGQKKPFSYIRENLLNKRILFHPSSIFDLKLLFFNKFIRFITLSFFASFLISSYSMSVFFLSFLRENLGDIKPLTQSLWVSRFSYTLFTFVLLDFFAFFQHYLMHRVRILWKIHKTHHTAKVLTPLTLNRIHPIEMFISMIRNVLVLSISSALYIYLFQIPVYGFDILGVNLFSFLFNALGANLRHSHIWISFGFLEYIFISPAQHQIHHSKDPKHYNKNLGVCFSFWDLLFKSFIKAEKTMKLEFGVKE